MTDLSKYKEIYVLEAEDNLEKLSQNLLALEKASQKQEDPIVRTKLLDELMRSAHTIKGSSASMGYNQMAFLTHVMEDVFEGARSGRVDLTVQVVNGLFAALDALEASLDSVKEKDQEDKLDEISSSLKGMTGVNTVGTGKSIRNQVTDQPKDLVTEPGVSSSEDIQEEHESDQSDEEGDDHEQAKKALESIIQESVSKIEHIKVPVERLDALMDLVEELLIDRMRLEQLKYKYKELKEISDHINLLTSSIQYHVMQARLVPVEQVFSRFPRMIRDLAQKLNKNVDFEIKGGEIELDRTIVDKLGEPLVHLLRNAVDHGVGETGQVRLNASRESDYVLITIENDGNAIDWEKVKRAAIKRGIITEKEAAYMDQTQTANLLFNSRLSTKDEVTEISGRGVGLGVVKKFTDSLGGQVIVENIKGGGARFILKLPLTIAIINSLLVETDGSVFAIPFSNIERSVLVKPKDIKHMADKEVAVIDGQNVPLLRLKDVFHIAEESREDVISGDKSVTAVIVRKDHMQFGVVIDRLIGDQEITIKPLSPVLRGVGGLSGSTILGDGQAILILDVANLIKEISD